MKTHARTARFGTAMLALAIFLARASATDAGARLYQAKCAQCHGKDGTGKPSIQAPSLISTEAKQLPDAKIRDFIATRANGEMERNPSHRFAKKRLTEDQITRIIAAIRKMQENHP